MLTFEQAKKLVSEQKLSDTLVEMIDRALRNAIAGAATTVTVVLRTDINLAHKTYLAAGWSVRVESGSYRDESDAYLVFDLSDLYQATPKASE